MVQWDDPAAQRWLLGAELRHYRESAGLPASSAARKIGCTNGKINHVESGRNRPQTSEVAALLALYGAPEADAKRLERLAACEEGKAWWTPWSDVIAPWFQLFAGLEGRASHEFLYEPIFVPGLLQTEAYARVVTEATPRVRADHVDSFVAFRRARATLLTEEVPLRLTAVIGEAALRLDVGDPAVLREQYRHLLDLGRLGHVDIRVLRPEDGIHSGFTGAFAVLGFECAHPVGYVELQDDAVYVHDPTRMRGYSSAAENLQNVALTARESARLIESFIHD